MSHTHPGSIPRGAPYRGHAHFWQRALARRAFMRAAAGTAGLALGSGLWTPLLAQAAAPSSGAAPKPIPGGGQPFGPGTEVFHNYAPPVDPQIGGLPWPELDMAQITDLDGAIGVARIVGTGTLTTAAGTTSAPYDADMRFMQGPYVGLDGNHHQGTFGFF